MKTRKSTVVCAFLSIGVIALVVQTEPIASSSSPTHARSFPGHYSEINLRLGPTGMSAPFTLPVLDQMVRMDISFSVDDGQFTFGDALAFFGTKTSEFQFKVGGGFSGTVAEVGGFRVIGTSNGTFTVQSDFADSGSLHLAMWY